MSAWGPQGTGHGLAPRQGWLRPVTPSFWVVTAVSFPVFIIAILMPRGGDTFFNLTLLAALVVGYVYGRRRRRVPDGRRTVGVIGFVLSPFHALAYLAGYGLSRWSLPNLGQRQRPTPAHAVTSSAAVVEDPVDALTWAKQTANSVFGLAGAHVGWHPRTGQYLTADPASAVLVLGRPRSGKSSAFLIPSVIVAPGAVVSSSIKGDVMAATAAVRTRLGEVWHFDPGGVEAAFPGVKVARWSPLVSIRSWEDARRMANRMAEPMRSASGDGNGAHFVDRARDWLEVLLYAAVLGGHPIGTAANWANTATDSKQGGTVDQVLMLLAAAEDSGDRGAGIAQIQLQGLLSLDDRERSGIASSLVRMMRLYGSVVARDLGETPNFDPVAFVRSADTLYVTASPERQAEYAPLIASLLEEIRFATYARHAAQEAGREPKQPHVTFVLDEANNTAPIPLPAIVSEAGGQSLHIIVGVQDLSRARERWGNAVDGFLTLFGTKLVLPGMIEPSTTNALSDATGEYDRQMVSYSQTRTPESHGSFFATYETSPSYSVQRQKVLTSGDISTIPPGQALIFEGARWGLVNVGFHWQNKLWIDVVSQSRRILQSQSLEGAAR